MKETQPTTATKERPILFSGPMVRAILDGRKTQTRRVVSFLKPTATEELASLYESKKDTNCVYGKPGDRLWVRESHAIVPRSAFWHDLTIPHREHGDDWAVYREGWERCRPSAGWKPSIHMPRKHSRLTLEVVSVRMERVQDISEQDAVAEGARRFDDIPDSHPLGQGPRWSMGNPPTTDHCLETARYAFGNLWESINGDKPGRSWEDNPWVWVVEFKRVESEAGDA